MSSSSAQAVGAKLATLNITQKDIAIDDEAERVTKRLCVPDRLKFEVGGVEGSVVGEVKVAAPVSKEDKFDVIVNWLLANGTKFPDLYLKKYAPTVRGVHAHRDIGPYKPILQVPLRCLITDMMGRQSEWGKRLFAACPKLSVPNIIAVVVFMLTDRRTPIAFSSPTTTLYPLITTTFLFSGPTNSSPGSRDRSSFVILPRASATCALLTKSAEYCPNLKSTRLMSFSDTHCSGQPQLWHRR